MSFSIILKGLLTFDNLQTGNSYEKICFDRKQTKKNIKEHCQTGIRTNKKMHAQIVKLNLS